MGVLVIVGGTTALVGALIALGQIDKSSGPSLSGEQSWLGSSLLAVGKRSFDFRLAACLLIYPLPMGL